MIKRLALILATLVAGLVGAMAVTAPAQAAPTCPDGLLCWFDANNWQGTKYMVATGGLNPGQCYNMGVDPGTGINWNNIVSSVWWNGTVIPGSTHAAFWGDTNCTGQVVTRPFADGVPDHQMHSCVEPAIEWNGPCSSTNLPTLISSWAFVY